ncbi:MAG TPA: 50S ribosomal protein L22 [Chloroflexi bacterium]|nr:50S ribosomal protein L22 [Chloroflexota bacterium]HHW84808.1 50S ribosomal protein L22 [Chloroflexota bacterium]
MEVVAKMKFTGISAQKTRLIVNEVRGRQAEEALAILGYMPQSAAKVVAKTVKSALSNAVENFGYDAKDMVITKIYADDAPIRKWRRFGARGRFKPWQRRSSHITVVLEERVPAAGSKASSN